jgi:hypothetical protein
MTAAYLQTLEGFSVQVVADACQQFKRAPKGFAPSAGEIYDVCSDLAARRFREEQNARHRLEAPREQQSDANREEMRQRFADLTREVAGSEERDAEYGRVPAGTKPLRRIVERSSPGSFLDRWEREKGYPNPHRERVMALVRGAVDD